MNEAESNGCGVERWGVYLVLVGKSFLLTHPRACMVVLGSSWRSTVYGTLLPLLGVCFIRTVQQAKSGVYNMSNDDSNDDGNDFPTDLDDLGPIAVACVPAGFDLENSNHMRLIAVLMLRFLTKEQIVGVISHVLQLTVENAHECNPDYYVETFGTRAFQCGHRNLRQQDLDELVVGLGKQEVMDEYREGKKNGFCASCGKLDDLRSCGRCHLAKYCSRDCQAKGWKKHKKVCTTAS